MTRSEVEKIVKNATVLLDGIEPGISVHATEAQTIALTSIAHSLAAIAATLHDSFIDVRSAGPS